MRAVLSWVNARSQNKHERHTRWCYDWSTLLRIMRGKFGELADSATWFVHQDPAYHYHYCKVCQTAARLLELGNRPWKAGRLCE